MSHLPNCQAPLPLPPPQKHVGPRTRRTERDRSRRGWSHPEHRGSAARGWTRPRLAMPSRRRMCGWWRRRVRHFAAERRISLGPGPERRQNIAAKIRPAPDKLPTATHRRCDGGKSSIELRRGAPGVIDGVWAAMGRRELAGSDVRRWTHYGDSARGREGADDARALAEGVPEHLVMVSEGGCNWRETIATSCNCVEGRLRRRLMKV